MKNTITNLRRVIRNLILSESTSPGRKSGARTINDLSPDAVVTVEGDFQIYIEDVLSEDLRRELGISTNNRHYRIGSLVQLGTISLSYDCMNSYEVINVEAFDGWGPLLYDLAMEVTVEKGGLGIYPSRYSVQREAFSVWKYYYENRKDVKWKQMDDRLNTLTPDSADNCAQPWGDKDRPYDTAYDGPDSEDWQSEGAVLSKVYYKDIELLPELRRRGILS